ncbi:MAG TPA: N-acetylglucosamine-6-phosphate deacetylase [Terriglobales bacterium]
MLALTANALFTPLERIEQPVVLIDDGKVVSISSRSAAEIPSSAQHMDFADAILAPGLIDLHVHGGVGYDVMQEDATARAAFERFLAQHGVTSYYPTTVTASLNETLRALGHLASAVEEAEKSAEPNRSRPLGIHLEGPFLSHLRRGVHPPEKLATPDVKTFDRFWQAARGRIRVMTIAPELSGALEVIAEANRRGVCVSIGHSDATLEQAKAGVAAGACHATHTFNAMRPLGHRDPGIAGEVLSDAGISADIIADGIHVHPTMVRLFLQAKGAERAVLITDATAATGMPEGQYMLGSLEVEVRDGKCLHDGKLAGSVLTLDRAVRNTMEFGGLDLQQSVRLASLNPARTVNIDKGTLQAGRAADLVALSPSGEVKAIIVNGVLAQ